MCMLTIKIEPPAGGMIPEAQADKLPIPAKQTILHAREPIEFSEVAFWLSANLLLVIFSPTFPVITFLLKKQINPNSKPLFFFSKI